jgi:hypothetical protein
LIFTPSRKNPLESPILSLKNFAMIRLAIFSLFTSAASVFAGNAGSALAAMQTISVHPVAQSAAFVELRGERGEPVPAEWIVLLADPSARGGVRELTVANGQITGERTPLGGFSDIASRPALDRAKVLVDAGSVFEIAQREAVQCELGFHWIDYSLATNPQTLQPEWTARLYDSTGSIAGTLRLSAVGGEVIEPLVPPEGASANEDSEKRVGGLVGKVVDFTESTAKKVQNTTLRTVGDVQEFLVGERTVGPKEKD